LAGKIFGGGTKNPSGGGTAGGGAKPPSGGSGQVTNPATGLPAGTGFGDDKTEYTTDSLGNVYKTMPDGTSELYRAADVPDEYMTDSLGNVYKTMPDGTYELYRAADVEEPPTTVVAGGGSDDENTVVAGGDDEDETVVAEGDDSENADTVVAEDDSGDDFFVADSGDSFDSGDAFAKNGGSMKKKTKGGLPRFSEGDAVYSDTTEEVQPWQNVAYNYGELDDPTMTGDQSLYSQSGPIKNTYVKSSSPTDLSDLVEGDSSSNPLVTNVDLTGGTDFTPTPGIQYFDDGSYIQTFDDGSTITVDSDGNIAGATDGYKTTVDDNGNTTVTDGYGNRIVYDPNGNVIPMGGGREAIGAITSGGGNAVPSYVAQQAQQLQQQQNQQPQRDQSGILDALKGYITQNPGLAGGAIGALLASLMNSSGESAGPSQPVDISALTAIAPRTTDFGPGMTGGRTGTGSSIVPYQDYDQGFDYAYTPDERLYSDLGVSGYLNEPDMTDYTDEAGNAVDQYGNALNDTETTEEPAMASGGATTHYTFGRAIDPAESLGLAQGMKKGGLSQAHTVHSHHTNPVIDNRIDFRQGSAVNGAGDGQSDDIPAWLADGEYVMDAELVSMLGNGSNKAGAKVLDKFREEIRAHKRSAPLGKIPPKAKSPLNYIKESMNG